MKVSRMGFLEAVERAASVAPTKTPKECWRFAKCEVHCSDAIKVRATNGESGIVTTLNVDTAPSGDFCIPAAQTAKVLKAMQSEPLEVEVHKSRVTLHGQCEKFDLPTIPADDWTGWKHDEEHAISVDQSVFRHAMQTVSHAMCGEENARYALAGINFALHADGADVAATDGRRLSLCELDGKFPEWSGTLSQPGVRAFLKSTASGQAGISLGKNSIELTAGDVTAWGRLVDGQFPDVRTVLSDHQSKIECNFGLIAGDAVRLLSQVRLATTDESSGVDIRLSAGELTMSGSSETNGESFVSIPIASRDSFKITVDGRFFLDAARAVDPLDTIQVSYCGHSLWLTVGNWSSVIMGMEGR